jgi:hypothetical protein
MKVQYFYVNGIRFPGSSHTVRLRFRLSFFPGFHHVPWQLACTICSCRRPAERQRARTKKIRLYYITICSWPQLQETKPWTCQFKHVQPHGQINQAPFHSLFMMSPSDLLATPVSECLQEHYSPSSLRDIWKLKTSNDSQHINRFNKHLLLFETGWSKKLFRERCGNPEVCPGRERE